MRFLAYALALSVLTAPALAQSLPSVPPTTSGETTQQPTEAALPAPVPLATSSKAPSISSTKPLSIAKVINRNTATLTTPTSTTAALSELEDDPRLQGVNLSLVEIQG